MKHQIIDGLYFGSADLRLTDVYEMLPDFFRGFSMLINCVDGSPNINWTSGPDLMRVKLWDAEILSGKLFVPESKLSYVFNDGNTFNGFDEIYLFREKPKEVLQTHFTSDRAVFGTQVPEEFLKYFKKSGSVRYLSDGIGLNYACESTSIMERICGLESR